MASNIWIQPKYDNLWHPLDENILLYQLSGQNQLAQ